MDLRTLENESLLMLYLSDELAQADRAELEETLRVDPAMREQLQAMRQLQAAGADALGRLDKIDPVVPSTAFQRAIGRNIRQWNVERLARPVQPPTPLKKLAWVAWSGGAVAAAVLVFCVWWGFRGDSDGTGKAMFADRPTTQQDMVALDQRPPEAPTPPDGAENRSTVTMVSLDASSERLNDLEAAMRDDLRLND